MCINTKIILTILLTLLPNSYVLASNFGGWNELFTIFSIAILLGVESFFTLIFFIFKKFRKSSYRNTFNIITAILFMAGIIMLLSFITSRGSGYGTDATYISLLLVAAGILAVVLPNYQYKKHAT